jgi:hypothetical protein
MDITNSTDLDTKYKVSSGGGTPMGDYHRKDYRIEDTVGWATLHAGGRISVPVPQSSGTSGPFTIYFAVQGKNKKIITVTAESSDDRLTLMRSGASFRVQVN